MTSRPAGWYHDPIRVGTARWHDGSRWTSHISFGGTVGTDPTPIEQVEREERRLAAQQVRSYLDGTRARHVVGQAALDALGRDLTAWEAPLLPPPAPQHALPPAAVVAPPTDTAQRPVTVPAQVEPTPAEPAAVWRWARSALETVRSDLAVHGLAYLGVLLLFSGVTGLMVFSFDEVRPGLRALSELLVPVVFLLSGWFLRRRKAAFVGSMLELVGFAVVPLVAIASVTDGSSIPPDVSGPALPLTQAAIVAVAGLAMRVVAGRSSTSTARWVWAPSLWLAAGLAAGATVDPVPSGPDMARPHSVQLAVMVAAIAVTVVFLRGRTSQVCVAAIRTALPAATVLATLELVAAGARDWPVTGAVVSGLALVVLAELLADRHSATTVAAVQSVAVALTAVRLGAQAPAAWVAVGAIVVAVVGCETTRRRRPGLLPELMWLVVATAALAVSLGRPGAAVTACLVATAWSLWRHLRGVAWIGSSDAFGIIPVTTSAMAAAEAWTLLGVRTATPSLAAVVLSVAIGGHLLRGWRERPLWRWWVPAASVAVSLASIAATVDGVRWSAGLAGACAAAALLLSSTRVDVRVWLVSVATAWSGANVLLALGANAATSAIVLACVGVALVVATVNTDGVAAAHITAVGLLAATLAPIPAASGGWPLVATLALATAAWAMVAAIHEARGVPHIERLRHWTHEQHLDVAGWLDTIPAVVGIAGSAGTALATAAAAGLDERWFATAVSATVVAAALVVRITRWRRASSSALAWETVLLAVAAVVGTALGAAKQGTLDHERIGQLAIGCAGVLAVTLLARAPRPATFPWLGWVAAGSLVPLLSHLSGVPDRWVDAVVAAAGALTLVGALAVDRVRHGDVARRPLSDAPDLLPPATVASVLLLVAGVWLCTDPSATAVGWSLIGLSVASFAAALAARVGALTAPAYPMAVIGLVLLAPWHPAEHPWSLVPVVAALLALAWAATRLPERRVLRRWDTPPFFAAHLVAAGALAATVQHGSLPATASTLGITSLAVAGVRRRMEWASAGAVLVVLGAAAAGPGWLSGALLLVGTVAHLAARRATGTARIPLLVSSAGALIASWASMVVWLSSAEAPILGATAVAASAAALGCAVVVRRGIGARDAGTALLGTTAALSVAAMVWMPASTIGHVPGGLCATTALIVLALASGQLAPLHGQRMRIVAGATVAAAWAPALWAWRPTATPGAVGTTAVALAAALATLGAARLEGLRRWVTPAHVVVGTSQALGVAGAIAALPGRFVLAVVLLAIATELVIVGVTAGRVELLLGSPALACAAWVVYASDALRGNPNWFTVPVGVALLATVGVLRWLRRRSGRPVASADVVVLEFVGMSATVAAAVSEVARGELWYSLLAIGAGVLLALWGAVTRVRRRLAFGAGTVVATVLLLIVVPLAAADIWSGPALWLTVISVGVVAILFAAFIERERAVAERALAAFGELTKGWEGINGG